MSYAYILSITLAAVLSVAVFNSNVVRGRQSQALLFLSIAFYLLLDPLHFPWLVLLAYATALAARSITKKPPGTGRAKVLVVSLLLLAAALGLFKIGARLAEPFSSWLGRFGIDGNLISLSLTLPIGISFFVFQLTSYLIDVHRRETPAQDEFGKLMLYAFFFPRVVAGPLQRAGNFFAQLEALTPVKVNSALEGVTRIVWGIFQKVVIADQIAPFVDRAYEDPLSYDGVALSLATWMYAFEIFLDFCGYTNIAIGAAMLFGFELSPNFRQPYAAVSIADFWKRWHITLTNWLTTYIYAPITSHRLLETGFYERSLIAVCVTFLVSGIWHGASATFIAWGALHALYLVLSVATRNARSSVARAAGLSARPKLQTVVRVVVTFNLVCLAYVLFRSEDTTTAVSIVARLPTGWDSPLQSICRFVASDGIAFMLSLLGIIGGVLMNVPSACATADRVIRSNNWTRAAVCSLMAVGIVATLEYGDPVRKFIYLRF